MSREPRHSEGRAARFTRYSEYLAGAAGMYLFSAIMFGFSFGKTIGFPEVGDLLILFAVALVLSAVFWRLATGRWRQ